MTIPAGALISAARGAVGTPGRDDYAPRMRKILFPITLTAVAFAAMASVATAWTGAGLIGGTWNGLGRSVTQPDITFPVHGNISIAADGTPSGTARLGAPLNCTVRWTPIRQTGAVTLFRETVTAQTGTICKDGGMVRLSPASDGRVRYVWTKGDLTSVAYLDGLTGQWTGTVTADDGGHFKANVIIRGTTKGGIEGSVGYGPPPACTGRWVPLGTNTPGWRRFTEVITRSSSTFCQGLGTSSVRLRSDGRLQYHWVGGPYSTTGVLTRMTP